MDLKDELLKSIWYAFTALDLEQSGKVSKSQLKVLSYNLYTVLNIPHDPKILEDHFRDDNDGPVSSHGYMPYLNKYILDKVQEGHFVKENFHELCWTLTAKKNYTPSGSQGLISETSAFKLWCLFNFLSEDKYPLVMVCEEVAYLLRKVFAATGQEWLNEEELAEYFSQNPSLSGAVTVWQFLEVMESGRFTKPASKESLTLGIQSVYEELVLDVMQKGYMWKKGNVRRNWNERWFVLKPSKLDYYLNEDLKEKKGEIHLDMDSSVEAQEEAEHLWRTKELHWMTQHEELQQKLQMELQKARTDKLQMQLVMEQKEQEAGAQRHRIRELETMQRGLERALRAEIEAHTNEQTVRSAQARLLQEEEEKLKELMMLRREQQDISRQEERQQQQQLTNKAQALQQAMEQLRESRQRNKQDLAMAEQTRRRASQHVKHWSVQLNRLMQPIVPGAAQNQPKSDIQSHRGGGAFIPKEIAVRRTEQHKMVPNPDCEERPGSDSEDYENMAEYIKNVSLTEANVIP
ncbi:differentially expressed in FDCP 6 homolog isoform X3 [Chiloscyllium plagiosum]|uniref:differentially expressed in FDCP 6 homolog isoform X3 n=1 Tax=Chiloscyllium plagiosum TaxID=36176 RepID=UPI001CB82B89|nr:differentially expressed in FDCP 6 homolog isoform X3 [Chiloscyllium plagiosum]